MGSLATMSAKSAILMSRRFLYRVLHTFSVARMPPTKMTNVLLDGKGDDDDDILLDGKDDDVMFSVP